MTTLSFSGRVKSVEKKGRKEEVDKAEAQHKYCQSSLGKQRDCGESPGEFLNHSREHEQAIASHVTRDQQEGKLPGQRHTDESIKILGMGNRWRKVQAGLCFHEVLGKQCKNPIGPGDKENSSREGFLCEHATGESSANAEEYLSQWVLGKEGREWGINTWNCGRMAWRQWGVSEAWSVPHWWGLVGELKISVAKLFEGLFQRLGTAYYGSCERVLCIIQVGEILVGGPSDIQFHSVPTSGFLCGPA